MTNRARQSMVMIASFVALAVVAVALVLQSDPDGRIGSDPVYGVRTEAAEGSGDTPSTEDDGDDTGGTDRSPASTIVLSPAINLDDAVRATSTTTTTAPRRVVTTARPAPTTTTTTSEPTTTTTEESTTTTTEESTTTTTEESTTTTEESTTTTTEDPAPTTPIPPDISIPEPPTDGGPPGRVRP